MLLLRLWNYVRGYVIILVEGYFLEKFINICTHRQIFLWDIKKLKSTAMRLKVSVRGFKLLRPIARKTGCRVRIAGKRGIPFLLNRYRRRKMFVVGAAVFLFLMCLLTSFIWTVEISGNKSIDAAFLMDKLAEQGIKPGVFKYGIDTDKVVNNLMLEIEELAWIGIVVKGTKAKVEVAERKQPPELVPKHIPCDIVAAKDGLVKSVIVKAGQEKVKAGDTVVKGQVLISGRVEVKNGQTGARLVHAMGSVKARTWYEGRRAVQTKVVEKERTGRVRDYYSLVLFAQKLDLAWNRKPFFERFERVEIRKKLSFGRDMELPFELVIDRYYENRIVEKEIGLDEAKQLAMDEAYKEASEGIPEDAEVVNTSLDYVQNDDGIMYANVIIECVEEIGKAKEIGGTCD